MKRQWQDGKFSDKIKTQNHKYQNLCRKQAINEEINASHHSGTQPGEPGLNNMLFNVGILLNSQYISVSAFAPLPKSTRVFYAFFPVFTHFFRFLRMSSGFYDRCVFVAVVGLQVGNCCGFKPFIRFLVFSVYEETASQENNIITKIFIFAFFSSVFCYRYSN